MRFLLLIITISIFVIIAFPAITSGKTIDEVAFAKANADWESKKQELLIVSPIFAVLSIVARNKAKDAEAELQECKKKNEGVFLGGFSCLDKAEEVNDAETLFTVSLIASIVTGILYLVERNNPPNRDDFLFQSYCQQNRECLMA